MTSELEDLIDQIINDEHISFYQPSVYNETVEKLAVKIQKLRSDLLLQQYEKEAVYFRIKQVEDELARINKHLQLSIEGGTSPMKAPEKGNHAEGLQFIMDNTCDSWSWWWAQRALGHSLDPVKDAPDRCKAREKADLDLYDRAERAETQYREVIASLTGVGTSNEK